MEVRESYLGHESACHLLREAALLQQFVKQLSALGQLHHQTYLSQARLTVSLLGKVDVQFTSALLS